MMLNNSDISNSVYVPSIKWNVPRASPITIIYAIDI